jgi:hypothetical protein
MQGRTGAGVEGREELILNALDDRPQPRELAATCGGDGHDVAAAVVGVTLTRDHVALLERVEHRDEPAWIDRQRLGDPRLRHPGAFAEDREDAVVVELEAGFLGLRKGLRLERQAKLGEQVAGACSELPRDRLELVFAAIGGGKRVDGKKV